MTAAAHQPVSLNGFPVIDDARTDGPLPRLRKLIIPGAGGRYLLVRDGSVGLVLGHVAMFFDEKVERLDVGVWDEWGYAKRPPRGQEGSGSYSNHASGTAIDLNATRHPRGIPASRNFTAEQIALIRGRLRFYDGVIDWGGDWTHVPDPMHFEIAPGTTLAAVEEVARGLLDTRRGKALAEANPGLARVVLS